MEITNTNNLQGKDLGIVTGTYVASRVFYRDWITSIRRFFGWEIIEYTQMMNDARDKVIERMILDAQSLGADAIINVRFNTAEVWGSTEILGYGTAIKKNVDKA